MEIIYRPRFFKRLKRLPLSLQEEVREKTLLFRDNPSHPFLKIHKLKGKLAGRWSFSVNYAYRVIFTYKSKDEAVLLTVGDHKIYRD